jgi:hypothetical protein
MTQVGFESKIPMFELAKTVHGLDRGATVIGWTLLYIFYFGDILIELSESEAVRLISD